MYVYIYNFTHIYRCMYTRIQIYICTYMCAYIYMYIYMYKYTVTARSWPMRLRTTTYLPPALYMGVPFSFFG